MDVDALFQDSPLLTEEDKQLIRIYFSSENHESVQVQAVRTLLSTTDASQPLETKFRLSETIRVEDGVRITETLYLRLNLLDKQWTKTRGVKKSKTKKVAGDA
jgi:hypothetical protein